MSISEVVRRNGVAFGLIALAALGLYAFFPYFQGYDTSRSSMVHWLWHAYSSSRGEWQHGALVPFISLFLVWQQRDALRAAPVRPSGWGLAAIVVSLASFWLGYAADIEYFGFLSLYLLVAGLILWLRGLAAFRIVLFPWAFLAFMFPLPFLDNMLAFPLRMTMSQAAHVFLNVVGIDNLRIGTAVVSAPNALTGTAQGARFAIDVADPCSGIRSLFALLMVGALYAHFTLDRAWKKWVLFLAAIPLAVCGNIARIVLLTLATLGWGSSFAIGTEENPTWFHMAAGYAVFAVALGGMAGVSWLLQRAGRRPAPEAAGEAPSAAPRPVSLPRAAALAAGAAATMGLCLLTMPPTGVTGAGVTTDLPYRVDGWWGISQEMSPAEKLILPSDTEFARKSYDSSSGDNIMASIVLAGAEKRSIHRPEICLPGQGWTIRNGHVVAIPLQSGRTLQAMNLTLERPVRTSSGKEVTLSAYYLYWFVGEDVTTPYHWQRMWLTSWDRLVHHVNHRWAYIIVTSPITEGLKPHGKSPEETLEMLKKFVADAVPSFQKDEMPPARP